MRHNTSYYIYRDDRTAILQAFDRGTSAFEAALNQYVDWTSQAAADLEDSIKSGPLLPKCSTAMVIHPVIRLIFTLTTYVIT